MLPRWTAARQLSRGMRYCTGQQKKFDDKLTKSLTAFAKTPEALDLISTLKGVPAGADDVDRDRIVKEIVDFDFKKNKISSLGAYRQRLLSGCGFEVTTKKQPKVELKRLAELVAFVATSRGFDAETFKPEFGLAEKKKEAPVVKGAEIRNEDDEEAAVELPASADDLQDAANGGETAAGEAEEADDDDDDIEAQQGAGSAPVAEDAAEEPEPDVQDDIDLDEPTDGPDAQLETGTAPAPPRTLTDKERKSYEQLHAASLPDDQSTALGYLFAAGLTAKPAEADPFTLPADEQAGGPEPSGTAEPYKAELDLEALAEYPAALSEGARHAHLALESYRSLLVTLGSLQRAGGRNYAPAAGLLADVSKHLAYARLKNLGGASFAGDRSLDELFDFAVYYSRPLEEADREMLTVALREIPVVTSKRAKKSRFPPPGDQRAQLARLSAAARSQACRRDAFFELYDALRPLLANLAAVVRSQLRRCAAEPVQDAPPAEVAIAAPAASLAVKVPTRDITVRGLDAEADRKPTSRIPGMRAVQLAKLIKEAQGVWMAQGRGDEVDRIEVVGMRVAHRVSPDKIVRLPFLQERQGELTWESTSMEDGKPTPRVYKLDPHWDTRTQVSTLSEITWVPSDQSPRLRWYRSATALRANRREESQEKEEVEYQRRREHTVDTEEEEPESAFAGYRETPEAPNLRRPRGIKNIPRAPVSAASA
ncbi:hypothetical protein DIPPA_06248 [Diplonema papillatum]|nr:hypothetical protein DIPPA_06248 [Diplonema papillatum]